jgi:hypothetical protein
VISLASAFRLNFVCIFHLTWSVQKTFSLWDSLPPVKQQ